jgi:uncharacterized membrane protein YphA (DoxX/SURF4 family)
MQNPIAWLDDHRQHCFELLRMYLGVGLFVRGVLFASDPALLGGFMSEGGFDAGDVMITHYVVLAHLCGGLMLAAGLLTRIAAAVQVPVLLGAVLFVHQHDGLFTRTQNLEFTVFVLFVLLLILAHGPGRWTLDWYLFVGPRLRAQRQALEHTV